MSRQKQSGFNSPFARVGDKLKHVLDVRDKAPPPLPAPPAPPAVNEGDLFAEEMYGVAPLAPDPRGRVGSPEITSPPPSRHAADEAEAYASLADLIEGSGPFDFTSSDEYIEGTAPGIDRRLLKRLRRGDYSVQGHLDLHGMTRDEARNAVDNFIVESRSTGKRCILVIHGRGLNSKDQIPVLKDKLRSWLARGRISRSVLAFSSARPCDGGAGAVYILLRR